MNLGMIGIDERRIEVLAQHMLCFSGAQLAVDITLRRALCATGEPQRRAAEVDGVLVQARPRQGERTSQAGHFKALSVGGGGHRDRWPLERRIGGFLVQLAQAKAREATALFFHSTVAWGRRWTRMIGTASAVSIAESVEPSDSLTWCHRRGCAVPGHTSA